ncbi:DUF1918 domain-containing protein [Streptomyces sp.]|uniref:DUF1918 domain-containing protein n=1 Tax=Streptomyces sp. TaxID=1931 RepID=UPI0034555BFD
MKATVGDRIVIQSRHVDEPERDGEIVEVHGPDGTPPYLVRWSDDGRTALLYPGPDAHIGGHTPATAVHHVTAWHATVYLTEEDGHTTADAVLNTGSNALHGRGTAYRNPADPEVPEIGDELATGRALVALGRRLIEMSAEDIGAIEGHRVHLKG